MDIECVSNDVWNVSYYYIWCILRFIVSALNGYGSSIMQNEPIIVSGLVWYVGSIMQNDTITQTPATALEHR